MSSRDFMMKIVIPGLVVLAVGFGIGRWSGGGSKFTEWDVALIDAGLVGPQVVKDILALPSTALTTDSSGKEIIAQQIVLKTERDGKPFVAILYRKQFTLLDNLTVVDTAEVKDSTK